MDINTEFRLIIFFAAKDEEAQQSGKTSSGAVCDLDYQFLISEFRHKLKKVGKTTRPFKYDLNQIPYDYTVEVINKFKGLDLIGPEELWMEVCNIAHEVVCDPNHQKEKEMQQGKMII